MTIFYVGSALLLILALVFIIWPLVKYGAAQNDESVVESREMTNISLYRDHLEDLEQSLSNGAINQEEYLQLKTELERNLLEDSQSSTAEKALLGGRLAYGFIAASSVLTLLFAVWLYDHLGAYDAWQVKTIIEQRGQLEEQYFAVEADTDRREKLTLDITAKSQELAETLSSYVEKKPDDLQMLALLARTWMNLRAFDKAIPPFRQILEQEPEQGQITAELAQAVFLQANNQVTAIAQSLVDRALILEPENTIALGLAGIGAFQQEKYQEAIGFWQTAVGIQGPSSPNSRALLNGIQAAQQRLSALAQEGNVNERANNSMSPSSTSSTAGDAEIMVSVSFADAVSFTPDDVVFVYARAWQGARVPLAIARLNASDLPLTLKLTNAMSMAPGMNLQSAEQLELVARLSKAGTPVPQPGDWQITSGPILLSESDTVTYPLVIAELIQ